MQNNNDQQQAIELSEVKKKALAGAVSYFMRTLLLQGVGFVSILILSKYFTPSDFGIYGIVIQIIGILVFFSDIGLAATLIQKKSQPTKQEYQIVFTVQFFLSIIIFLTTLLIAQVPLISEKLGDGGIWVLYALGASFPLATLKTIPSVLLERKLDFSKVVLPQIFEQIVFHAILIVLALSGLGVVSYAYAVIARALIGAVVMWIIQPWPIGISFDFGVFKGLINFGVKFQANDLLARVKDQLFYLTLGLFLPTNQFGYIQWAKNWSMYPYNLTVQNVMAITFPSFSRLQDQTKALSRAIEKSLFFISLVIFPIIVGMSVFIVPLLKVMPDFQKWLPAAASLIMFSLSVGWSAISTPLTNTLNALGKINTTLKLMLFWTAATWILTPIGVYLFGFNGVALSALVISFSSYLSVWYVQKVVPFDFLGQIWRQTLASVVMAVVGLLGFNLWQQNGYTLIVGMLIAGSSYIMSLLIFGKDKLLGELSTFSFVFKRKHKNE